MARMAAEPIGSNNQRSELIILLHMTLKIKEEGGGGFVDELIGSDNQRSEQIEMDCQRQQSSVPIITQKVWGFRGGQKAAPEGNQPSHHDYFQRLTNYRRYCTIIRRGSWFLKPQLLHRRTKQPSPLVSGLQWKLHLIFELKIRYVGCRAK